MVIKVQERVSVAEVAARAGLPYKAVWYGVKTGLYPGPSHTNPGMSRRWYTEREAQRLVALLIERKGEHGMAN